MTTDKAFVKDLYDQLTVTLRQYVKETGSLKANQQSTFVAHVLHNIFSPDVRQRLSTMSPAIDSHDTVALYGAPCNTRSKKPRNAIGLSLRHADYDGYNRDGDIVLRFKGTTPEDIKIIGFVVPFALRTADTGQYLIRKKLETTQKGEA
jgi:hypothetical protein